MGSAMAGTLKDAAKGDPRAISAIVESADPRNAGKKAVLNVANKTERFGAEAVKALEHGAEKAATKAPVPPASLVSRVDGAVTGESEKLGTGAAGAVTTKGAPAVQDVERHAKSVQESIDAMAPRGAITDPGRQLPGPSSPLMLPAPKGSEPWMPSAELHSMPAPPSTTVEMAMSPGQVRPGGWATFDRIPDVDYVRNELAVTPGFKEEISHVQKFLIPEGVQIQVGTVGPQTWSGITYSGGGNQVQILNYADRNRLIPIGEPRPIK
jgi:hypothetical protein